MKKTLFFIFQFIVSVAIFSCSSEMEDTMLEPAQTSKMESAQLDDQELDVQILYQLAVDPSTDDKIVIIRGEYDKESQSRIFEYRYISIDENISRVQTRSERDDSWQYWGIISSIWSTKKFYSFLEDKYPDKNYEIRLERCPEGKRAYYREAQ